MFPRQKKPTDLIRDDGKRASLRFNPSTLVGLTLVSWQIGRGLTWDVTAVDALASYCTPITSATPCGAAEAATPQKRTKYVEIIQSHIFVPVAIETLAPLKMDGQRFLDSFDVRLSSVSNDPRETTFLYWKISAVLISIFNMVVFPGSFLPRQ